MRTVLATGTVRFESTVKSTRKLEQLIEPAWPEQLGFTSRTIVRSREELADVVHTDPYGGVKHGPASYELVTFVKAAATAARCDGAVREPRTWIPSRRRARASRSRAHADRHDDGDQGSRRQAWFDRQLGKENTSRTLLTVTRILRNLDRHD